MGRKVLFAALTFALAAAALGTNSNTNGQDAKAKGRLPPYYAAIVTDKQRQIIYAVQAKYEQQIAALNDQLQALEKQRNLEIENVLTPDQRLLLKKAQDEATAKRKKSAEEKKAEEELAKAPPAEIKKAMAKKMK
jgi:hypothetical protein